MDMKETSFKEVVTTEYNTFIKKYEELINKRFTQTKKNVAQKAFKTLLLDALWISHCTYFDGLELLDILIDDDNLVEATQLSQNFVGNITTLLTDKINNNQSFQNSFPKLLGFSSKGIGNGELLLPLLIRGWKKEDSNDGVLNGKVVEIKNFDGGSMKPVKSGMTSKGHIDELNARLFGGSFNAKNKIVKNGHPPFHSEKEHKEHLVVLNNIEDKKGTYLEYFSQILAKDKSEVNDLVDDLLLNIIDMAKCKRIYGEYVLKEYKEIDGFDIIMLINPEDGYMVSIADFDNVPTNVEFTAKMIRGKDTQATPDGYVNIKVKKTPKPRAKKKK
jgi:hypothetical protein